MALISVEIPFGDMMVQVNGYYSPRIPGRWYLSNGDPGYPEELSEFEVDSLTFEGYDLLPELQQMYIKTKDGRFISYLESIDSELCAKADEAYMGREECYEY